METSKRTGRWRWKFRLVLLLPLLLTSLDPTVLGCNLDCNQELTDPQGGFTSPCYPQDYPNSQGCTWTLQAPSGFILQLTFLDFELEEALGCIYDRVIVNTGSAAVTFCGLTANGLNLNSTGNVMVVTFTSDFSVQKKGFSVVYRQVAVALRNQKVTLSNGNGKAVMLSDSVAVPTLVELTVCFEIARSSQKSQETVFTYEPVDTKTYANFTGAEFSLVNNNGMEFLVGGEMCSLESIITASDINSSMKAFCLTWSSSSGLVALYFNGNYRAKTCANTAGRWVTGGWLLRLGSQGSSMEAAVYNFRLWSHAMAVQQLAALTCDVAGGVVDWDSSFWVIPSSQAQTDSTLSCSTSVPAYTSATTTTCASPGPGCPEGQFFSMSLVVSDSSSSLLETDIEWTMTQWLNQTFQNWTYAVYVDYVSVQPAVVLRSAGQSYTCQALLVHSPRSSSSLTLGEADLSARLRGGAPALGSGLLVTSVSVQAIENCPVESPLHYPWSETRPTRTQHLPCFPNKDQNASRTCVISPQNYTAYWGSPDLSNCTDIETIEVSAENAAEVAVQLADITNNELSNDEVSKVVTKVKELVGVAKINATLATTVVTIISNVMTSSDSALAAASGRTLKTVDELMQKIEFQGPSVSITSRNLALGISALNASQFKGTSFSAFIPPNTTDPQIDFESEQLNPLGQVVLPATLLTNLTLTDSDTSRINFMFFSKVGLFQNKQNRLSLNSYVVASSVGHHTIRNLKDPVEIAIVHLNSKHNLNPVCMFWDFTMNNGAGGWNGEGCRLGPESNGNRTVCLCDHLTHFGILMDISGASAQIDERNNKILTFITYIGCGISAIFSAATLLTYIAFEKLRRDYPSKILMNLSTSLLFLNMLFLLDGWLASFEVQGLCVAVAAFLHYFLLSSFTWMGLESIHMYIALVKVFNTYIRRYILKFCIVGWGLPAAIVTMVVAVDRTSYGKLEYGAGAGDQGASEFCWITNAAVFYSTCVGYFSLVFLMNVAMFIVVMIQICGRNGKRSNRTLQEEVLRNLRSVVSLTFLLGMTWGFAFFAWGPVSLAFMYLFTIFNSLQGLFIFVFHCFLKENVQKQWRRYLCCGRFRLADNSDWSKTATNNTKKVSSDNLGKSLSSSSFGSSTTNWTSKAKATLNPFTKRSSNTGKGYSNQTNPKCVSSSCSSSSEADPSSSSSSSSILPVHQVIDKVKGYCSVRSDNFYKNIILSDSFSNSTKF